jgi:catechol 2,3-dioxygenase-like lactoylglutathione lyase family enzyme
VFDHITLRVPNLATATTAFAVAFDQLEIEKTTETPSFSVWGNFAITQTDAEHPITRRIHIAFSAPTKADVDRFARAGIDAGFADDGPDGLRPEHGDGDYATCVRDTAGNEFEAVRRDGGRASGNIDHVGIGGHDVEALTAFYTTIGTAAGLTIRGQAADHTAFSVGESNGSLLVIAGEPTQNAHIAFSGDDEDVRRFHGDAIAAGYRSHGEPGERPRYHPGYCSAYVLDPGGNNIEVVNHHPTAI